MATKNFIEELEWRGMIHTIMPGAKEQLEKEMTTAYLGIDPTADSLHIGHLVGVMILKHFQMCGHRPLALIGGATGMIGDPSGKSQERNLLDEKTLRHNQEAIKRQLAKLLDFDSDAPNAARMVNNYDWMKDFTFLDFIRDIGKCITVNYMMAKDSVKKRFSGEGDGMSFTEFTYQLVQGFDFLHLYETVGCKLQLGGADQWGNITTGTELIRRKLGAEAFGITCPLITKADGTKFGKTESGNVWLDPRYTSPYKFYQFWLNTSDEDAKRYIKIFTLLDRETIGALIAEHDAAPHLRVLQKRLAQEITTMIHSREEYEKAVEASAILFGGTTSGKAVTERSAMQMTAVYSCVRILAEAVAGLPLHLYRYKEDGGKEKAIDHPLYLLLHDEPNPEMSSFVFRETLMTHLLLWGNAYAQIIRNGKGEVIALYPLMPDRMTVNRDSKGQLYYEYTVSMDDAPTIKGSLVRLNPSDVLHIPGLGFDGLVGYSPIAMAKNAIGMAIACEEYGAKFFANGAAPGGVLEHPGTIKDPQRVRESWQSTFGGSGNSNKIAVLEEGMKYTPIGISPEQAQFLETRKFQINEIARIFRVPPHMVGDLEKSSFSNIEQQSLEFVKYTLDPWVIRWEQSIQRSLLSKDEKAMYFVKFNLEGLLRGDYQSRMNGYAIGRQNGWMSANDIRELENLDRIPKEDGGDLYLINGNMLPLQNAGAFANINTDNGKEEKSDEEVLELEKQDSDQRGDAGTDPRENPVLKRHDR